MSMKPSALRVSTMTVTGNLGAIPNLQKLYDEGYFVPYWWIGEGIIKIEFGQQQKGICMEDILHTTTKTKKRFVNQSSLVFRLKMEEDAESAETLPQAPTGARFKETAPDGLETLPQAPTGARYKETNIKLFINGGFQMTGISSEAMARASLTRLIALTHGCGIWSDDDAVCIKSFNVCMMNSDYNVGKAIRRDRLYRILVEEYGLQCSYEPMRYQGVNTKFYWNAARPVDAPPGICPCPEACKGDGGGYAIGECKKITISPFRTGSVIITGAKDYKQLGDAYDFINGVLQANAESVLRDEAVLEEAVVPTQRSKKVQVPLTTPEAILRQKMRASPRNVVRLAATTSVGTVLGAAVAARQ
jgi:hypothetical protein